jgi:porphyrinogen peroxidase
MRTPQSGIYALGTASHAYLELDAVVGRTAREVVDAVSCLREPRTTMGGVNLVAGFKPELWRDAFPAETPADLHGFNEPIVGVDDYTMPATQHDAVLWISGSAYDVVFDVARMAIRSLNDAATVVEETSSWPYQHDRDLTGFIDGTENPTLVEATALALVPPGTSGEGSSILLLQQWEHDASSWEALPVASQEAIIGRRKSDSVELESKPETSHVARTDQDRFGRIFRRNIAYGSLERHGTIFVGFAGNQRVLAEMLDSMVGRDGGPSDKLTSFTRPLTGAYYVIPPSDLLAAFGGDARA